MGKKKWLRGVMAMAVAGSLLISAAPGSLQAPKASAAVKLTGKTKRLLIETLLLENMADYVSKALSWWIKRQSGTASRNIQSWHQLGCWRTVC